MQAFYFKIYIEDDLLKISLMDTKYYVDDCVAVYVSSEAAAKQKICESLTKLINFDLNNDSIDTKFRIIENAIDDLNRNLNNIT
jgi:hypothetical protein